MTFADLQSAMKPLEQPVWLRTQDGVWLCCQAVQGNPREPMITVFTASGPKMLWLQQVEAVAQNPLDKLNN
jgi:hypothetical protein